MRGGGSLLFVDNGGPIRAAVESVGVETIEAVDGTDVLKRLDHEPADIVVLPGDLPDIPLEFVCRRVVDGAGNHPPIVVGGTGRAPMIQLPADIGSQALADRIGRARQHRRFRREMDRHDRVERALAMVADTVTEGSSDDPVTRTIGDALRAVGAYQFVVIGRCLDDSIEVSAPFHQRVSPVELGSLLGALDPAFVEAALTSDEVTVEEASDDAAVLTAVPLSEHGRSQGVVIVGSGPGDAPDGAEQALLRRIGRLGGLALAREPDKDDGVDRSETLFRIIDHELRNILQEATFSLSAARDGDQDALDRMARSLDSVESVLETGRILATDETVADTEPIDLGALAERAWATVGTSGATLAVRDTVTVDAHQALLHRLLWNLLANAAEHGGEEVTVSIGSVPQGFYVEDDGAGIPHEMRASVFEWGYTTSMDGLGVGLSLVEEIVEAHRWSLELTEGTDGGARFEITVAEGTSGPAEDLESLFGQARGGFVFEGEPTTK